MALDYQRVTGTCVQPLLPDGAWIGVDHDATAEVGDLVVVRWGADLVLKQLAEWEGRRWLVAKRDVEPVRLEPPLAIVGVVRLVIHAV